jgi:hypothetical protein
MATTLRLEPQDEYLHELGPERTFNESMYFNVYDPTAEVGGFVRLGNRANEGHAEMTTCVYLPDGRVAFTYFRPEIGDNDAFDAGGMRFDVVEPFEELKVGYDGKVVLLDDPLEMADPRAAFTNNPWDRARIELTYTRVSDMVGGEPTESHEREGEEFAKGHYEQHRGRRRGVGHRRLRAARPLLGTPHLAGPLVLPVADGQLRARLRLHGLPHRPPRPRRDAGRLHLGR